MLILKLAPGANVPSELDAAKLHLPDVAEASVMPVMSNG